MCGVRAWGVARNVLHVVVFRQTLTRDCAAAVD